MGRSVFDHDKIGAVFENGVLTVTLPKKEEGEEKDRDQEQVTGEREQEFPLRVRPLPGRGLSAEA